MARAARSAAGAHAVFCVSNEGGEKVEKQRLAVKRNFAALGWMSRGVSEMALA